jgi:electron transfer flavoprotein beta subunit
MKVVVCINHVPDTETKIKVAPDNISIDKTGVNYMMSPYDEIAVEEGLRIRDKFKGEVIAISLGGEQNKETLRKALAMGVDKVVLLKDDGTRDSFGVAQGLAEEIKTLAPDVILFGKQSIDYDDAQVGTMVAEMLGLPSVGVVVKMDIQEGKVVCQREIEGGHETVEIDVKPAAPADVRVETVQLRKPPAKNPGRILGTDKSAVPELIRLLHEEAKVI